MSAHSSINAKAVVLDVYGTLIKLAGPTRAYDMLLASASRKDSRRALTEPLTLADCAKITHTFILLRLAQSQLAREITGMRPYEGTFEALALLREKGLRIALCSNLAQDYIAPVDALFADEVDTAVYSCQVGLTKPSADIFHMACARLEVAPEDTLVIGNSESSDFMGARAAGLQAALVKPETGVSLLEVVQRINPL